MVAWAGPHDLPFLLNVAGRTDRAVAPDEVLDAAATFFAPLKRGYEVAGLVDQDADLLDAAQGRGYRLFDPDPLQVLTRVLGPAVYPAGVTAREVTDESGVADLIEVARDAHRLYDFFPDDVFPRVFARPETVIADDIACVVAYADCAPAATAQVFLWRKVAYVGWVAVARSAMRRGLGTAVTMQVVDIGFERGAEVATLSASPIGAPIYRRMGFVDVGLLQGAVAPASIEGY